MGWDLAWKSKRKGRVVLLFYLYCKLVSETRLKGREGVEEEEVGQFVRA